jgi:hypothetical protein
VNVNTEVRCLGSFGSKDEAETTRRVMCIVMTIAVAGLTILAGRGRS